MKYFLLFVFFLSFQSIAQQPIQILDKQSQEPIPGVFVKVGKQVLISDDQGVIQYNFQEGDWLFLNHLGYENLTTKFQKDLNRILLVPFTAGLSEVVVRGFESERPLLEQAGAIVQVKEHELYRFNENSILSAFNTKAGVRVEQRAPASYRISIRGSSLRSPFGVRNVKVYWNDIPFTFADGTTDLNILDLTNIQQSEIIKGPSGSIFGAGNGGVIRFESKQQVQENYLSSDLGVGDFGLLRYRIGIDQQLEKGSISASYVHQQSDGYREHSAMDRKVVQIAYQSAVSEKQSIATQILYSDLHYQIPGALNPSQVEENRRQARPGSVEQNSSIAQQTLFGTLRYEVRFNERWKNISSLYVNTKEFENPFILDYKRETAFSYGGRTAFTNEGTWGRFPVRLVVGGEYQYGNTAAQNFGNRNGVADTVRFSDDLITTQAFLFQQLELDWTSKLRMTVGLSENFSRYDILRSIDAGPNAPSSNSRRFDPLIIPRLAMVYRINELSGVHGSISSGFSPPTIAEVRTNEGSINLDLEAERGINYEIGYRSQYGIFNLDVTAFYFQLDQTITTFTNEQGVVLFRNAGATDQRGIEASLDYAPYRNQATWIREVRLNHAYTGHYFTFARYESRGTDFSGNQLTGVAPHTLVNLLDVRSRSGFYINITHQYVDQIPLNDANTVFQDAYHLVGSRIGWRESLGSRWDLDLYGGVDNILDETYSLGNDLNAFANRFYQPAPGRNFYGGIKVGLRY
ncbi:TonB-dependent receptor family protein [Mongoliitalea daihaiensis]|uniref:TonB-dependent receptor family protein n=1 Tax=Mongoliitalea daihaiensis TaxID=2782006 RepID=UPI001F350A17|nr:TonB-dependent receptor [Mongoliitalea daihaiensis]UJP65683.1 TonB-dependent receptor [Mongoliitalea daihaiensis]